MHHMVEYILRKKGVHKSVGKNWIFRFMTRHKEFKAGRVKILEIHRLVALDKTTVSEWFTEYIRIRNKYNVAIDDILNMDETGFQMGQTGSSQVIYTATRSRLIIAKGFNT